jgi:hypothetical protein
LKGNVKKHVLDVTSNRQHLVRALGKQLEPEVVRGCRCELERHRERITVVGDAGDGESSLWVDDQADVGCVDVLCVVEQERDGDRVAVRRAHASVEHDLETLGRVSPQPSVPAVAVVMSGWVGG